MNHVVIETSRDRPRIVVAMDSFKGSVTSAEANGAVRAGALRAAPEASVTAVAVADGGEGTLAALAASGRTRSADAVDLLGRHTEAPYVALDDAVAVESASTVGLTLLDEPSPETARRAHSFGLGLQVRRAALATDAHRVLIGLGGTGTTDGGIGMLLALGARIRTADGATLEGTAEIPSGNPLLLRPVQVDLPRPRALLLGLSDVSTPLLGPRGAARLFGPQKGADAALVEELERAMKGWAAALACAGADVASSPGAGAAGGLGAAVLALGGELTPGLDRVFAETGAGAALAEADLVITGEGCLDAQTAEGKATAAIARLAARGRGDGGARVVALAGSVAAEPHTLAGIGLADAIAIHEQGLPLARAMDRATTLAALERAATRAVAAHLV
ncbi:glycerate kinase [Demequina sp. NBRC 110054]|uniref:glycerate kinase n=1 Tax=Demequina sp. NBRC 110054 TaxID=1570343 RepID=UPI00135635FC|nr:glycerate kinase [Demequina sp. NBRC 110054]